MFLVYAPIMNYDWSKETTIYCKTYEMDRSSNNRVNDLFNRNGGILCHHGIEIRRIGSVPRLVCLVYGMWIVCVIIDNLF